MPPPSPDRSLRIIRALAGTADDVAPGVIRAYHGSPHSFSRFDASKIGTGEGAQSYGYGLYFAGNESAADYYRLKLAEDGDAPDKWARDYWAAQAWPEYSGSPEEAYHALLGRIQSIREAGGPGYSGDLKNHYDAAEQWLLAQDPHTVPGPIRQGHMYEVELGVPESSLLTWDAPLSQQPEAVQAYAGRAGIGADGSLDGRWGGEILWSRRRNILGPQEAARELLEAGIPGIRYYDAGSRRAGAGTRNYVMFPGTEDRIRILRQYGLLPPLVAAGALQYE